MNEYEKMTQTRIPSLILKLAIPTIIAMLISAIYNLADTFFVSKLGDSPSAAISVVFSVQTLIQSFGFTVGMGAGSIISQELGKKKEKEASILASSGIFLGFILGIIIFILGLVFLDEIIYLLGASETASVYAKDYAKWIFVAAPFMMCSFVLNNILRAEGKASLSMIGIGIGGLLNIGLDPICIFLLKMDTSGAGFATMISQIISFIILISFFRRKRALCKLRIENISDELSLYGKILKNGSPTLVRQGFSTSANIILSFLGKGYGDYVVAALGITAKIYMFVRNIIIGIGQGYQPVLGYNYGAKLNKRIKDAFSFTLLLQTIVCIIATLIVFIMPSPLIRAFRDSPEVISVGKNAVRYLAISLPVLGFSTIVNQSLQVIGYSKSASFLASLRQGLVYTPVIFILNAILNETGLALTQPVADVITAIISVPFLFYFYRILDKNVNNNKA